MKQNFAHVRHWVFDLDNTLYPPSARLFDQIEVLMTDYVMESLKVQRDEADHLRTHYWQKYGTTLSGLMREHNVDPTPYLTYVHEISLENLNKDPKLARAINALPGRKIVYTNGSAPYANRVISARDLDGVFDAVYGVEHAGFHPKPDRLAFQTVFSTDGTETEKAAMFEDDRRNLAVPHEMGMQCVLIAPTHLKSAPHIHHHTDDLTGFLENILNG
ncbi:MAG TPA: pyrimidine 5'-nucleotidase [Rhodobacteraceae bacterium]|jgi:putative hydrolase of the HAD superfamily|nr:pyrimidine 5'-nucleotidase [Paracoccaceae bacterium]